MSDKDPKGLKQTFYVCNICDIGFMKKNQYHNHKKNVPKRKENVKQDGQPMVHHKKNLRKIQILNHMSRWK